MSSEDRVVILARGASSRMGSPKGLCRVTGDRLCFLARIVKTHLAAGHTVSVATTRDLHLQYAAALDERWSVHWILGEAGRGTADTVTTAARELDPAVARVWLHPVDLPLVSPEVLAFLRNQALRHPDAAIVPVHADQPGHPVILPSLFMKSLREHAPTGKLRDWLLAVTRGLAHERVGRLINVLVDEPAVVTDYDDPAGTENQ